jgi:hypothetical protein
VVETRFSIDKDCDRQGLPESEARERQVGFVSLVKQSRVGLPRAARAGGSCELGRLP